MISPEHQHLTGIANLLAYIDGSIMRACVQCGTIFKVPPGSARMFCEPCQCERERLACCEAPNYRIVSTRSNGDVTFSIRVCENCGERKEIES